MTPSTDLFDLIKTLSKTEKRYFKLLSSLQEGDKGYLKLFDYIDAQEIYDEKQLKKHFAKEAFIKRLPALKNYLYSVILKSLRYYDEDSSIQMQLKQMLQEVQILSNKGLYKQCEKILSRARQAAKENELFLILIEIMHLQYNLRVRQNISWFDMQTQEKIIDEINQSLIFEQNLNNYFRIYNKVMYYLKQSPDRKSSRILQEIKHIIQNPLLQDEKIALSHRSKVIFYAILSASYDFLEESKNSYVVSRKNMILNELNHYKTSGSNINYLRSIYNFFIACLRFKKHSECSILIKKFSKIIPKASKEHGNYLFSMTIRMELFLNNSLGRFKESLSFIEKKIEANYVKDKRGHFSLIYEISKAYFGAEKYKEALNWLNKILNEMDEDILRNIRCDAQIYNLIIHYELGNMELIEYAVKSTYRFLRKERNLHKYDMAILRFMQKKIPKINTLEGQIAAFKELKVEMEIILKDPLEKRNYEYFDIISWLQSKIENCPFAQIVQEKAKREWRK